MSFARILEKIDCVIIAPHCIFYFTPGDAPAPYIARLSPGMTLPSFSRIFFVLHRLIHWGRVTHICVGKFTIIGSHNGLSPERRQAIIWTNDGILLIRPLGTNFSEILIGIQTFSFKKMHLKMSSGKWRPFCPGLNELTHWGLRWQKMISPSN